MAARPLQELVRFCVRERVAPVPAKLGSCDAISLSRLLSRIVVGPSLGVGHLQGFSLGSEPERGVSKVSGEGVL